AARSNTTMSIAPPPPSIVQPSITPTPQTPGLTQVSARPSGIMTHSRAKQLTVPPITHQRANDQMNDGKSSSESSNNSSLKDIMQEHEQDDMLDTPSDSKPPNDWEAGLDDLHPGSMGQQ
ncbi:hypothetical protein EV182_001404, partial [Spiromyces aspiralis]